MLFRNYWRDQMEAGKITERQYSNKIRRACKVLYLQQQREAEMERILRERRQGYVAPPIERVMSR
jgi:hypothetical protein